MSRILTTRVVSVVVVMVLLLSTIGILATATRSAAADNQESSCSGGSWTLQWVKQVDANAGEVYVTSVTEAQGQGDGDGNGHGGSGVYDGVGIVFAATNPLQQIILTGLGSGTNIYTSASCASFYSTYGTIYNNLFSNGGLASSPDGSFSAWASTTGSSASSTGYLNILCTSDQDSDDSPPLYTPLSLNGMTVTGTHNTVNLVPISVSITSDNQYVVVGDYHGYVAVWQWTTHEH